MFAFTSVRRSNRRIRGVSDVFWTFLSEDASEKRPLLPAKTVPSDIFFFPIGHENRGIYLRKRHCLTFLGLKIGKVVNKLVFEAYGFSEKCPRKRQDSRSRRSTGTFRRRHYFAKRRFRRSGLDASSEAIRPARPVIRPRRRLAKKKGDDCADHMVERSRLGTDSYI